MNLSRRDLASGAALAVAALAASSVSACAPLNTRAGRHVNFFHAVQLGNLSQAKEFLDPEVSLSVVTLGQAALYAGPDDVTGAVFNIMRARGWHMIGDGDVATVGGLYWIERDPWLCSDMVKSNITRQTFGCGESASTVLNVFLSPIGIGVSETSTIKRIVLIESNRMMIQEYVEDNLVNG